MSRTPSTKSRADEGIENQAYGYLISHNDRTIDDWRIILEAPTPEGARTGVWPVNVTQTPNTEYLVEDDQNAKIGITSTKANRVFIYDKSNQFAVNSKLASYRRTLTTFEWRTAVPFTFRPGYKICYHFDHEDETARDLGEEKGDSLQYATKNGVVEAVVYDFQISKHIDQRYIMYCTATITASLELETTYYKDE